MRQLHSEWIPSGEGLPRASATSRANDTVSAPKRSVLLIGNFLSLSVGTRSVCEDLADRLLGNGWAVSTSSHKPGRIPRLVDMCATVWKRRDHYAVAQVDVFSGLAFAWAEVVCWMLRRIGKPYVLTLHGGGLPEFAGRWPNRVRRLLNTAAKVTVPSRYLLDQMSAYRNQLLLLPNPLNLDAYKFRPRVRPRSRLIWLRAFHKIYNPTLVPEIVSLIAKEYPDVHVTMIGPDKGDGSLQATRRKATDLGVANQISFVDSVPKAEVPAWLDKGDVFINTTNVDNTPVSVLEAMACGLCVVSTNVGGLSSMLKHDHDALLVPPQDAAAMAAAILRICNTPELAESLSRNGRANVESFDWSVVLPQWESIFETAAQRHR